MRYYAAYAPQAVAAIGREGSEGQCYGDHRAAKLVEVLHRP